MKSLKLITPLLLAVFVFTPKAALASEIVLAADNWCPINCEPNSANPGFMIEIAKAVFEDKGHTIKYIQLPWKRAVLMARAGKIDGIIGAFHGDAPDFIYPEAEQAVLTNSFYALKSSPLTIRDFRALKRLTLGYIDGYDYGDLVNTHIKTATQNSLVSVSGNNNLIQRLMTLLESKRVDVIVEADLVFMYEAKKVQKSTLFKHVGNAADPMKAYIAFSPNKADSLAYAKLLSEGMESLKRSGELDRIMAKYLEHQP